MKYFKYENACGVLELFDVKTDLKKYEFKINCCPRVTLQQDLSQIAQLELKLMTFIEKWCAQIFYRNFFTLLLFEVDT